MVVAASEKSNKTRTRRLKASRVVVRSEAGVLIAISVWRNIEKE
jgi:hypothetical protein